MKFSEIILIRREANITEIKFTLLLVKIKIFQKVAKDMRMLNKEEMSIILQRPDCLTCLPMIATLPNGRSVIIDRMTDLQLTETYCMIQEAAQHNDGYGIDEFLTEADFRNEIVGSDCFAITCKSSGEMLAGFILAISKFYRGAAGVVDPFIIVKRSERNQKLGQFAFQKAVDFSKKLGYMGMYVDTFSNNVAIQRILEKLGGFTKVGMLPLGGRLNNGRLIGSVIYYKDLTDDGLNVT